MDSRGTAVKIEERTKHRTDQRIQFANTGAGPVLQAIDIKHPVYMAVLDPDTAFWALVRKEILAEAFTRASFLEKYLEKREGLLKEMNTLRFELKPSAVYFNPTERCNLNCTYCYIPENTRKRGIHMSKSKLVEALDILYDYFSKSLPEGKPAQIIFHGSEPMLNREAVFEAMEIYKGKFNFGVQTNGTILDNESIHFLTKNEIGIGLSLDGHIAALCDKTRKTWTGKGVFGKVVTVIERLKGYDNFNVICTVTRNNVCSLSKIIEFFHSIEVPVCMLNPVRCTQPGARTIKPSESTFAHHYMAALDRSYDLYQRTGRKIVVANFANVLVSILAPMARRLMCDISPCGGGRCFFAVSATGGLFPCSEFIGLPEFEGGNLFRGEIEKALSSKPFQMVTNRLVENIESCHDCAIRHFCGAPCPAEAYSMNDEINRMGAFCEFYEEQVRYAFRQIAEEREDVFLWDNWDTGTLTTLDMSGTL